MVVIAADAADGEAVCVKKIRRHREIACELLRDVRANGLLVIARPSLYAVVVFGEARQEVLCAPLRTADVDIGLV